MSGVRVDSYVEEAKEEVHNRLLMCLEKICLRAEKYAKFFCPVDTGNLRNSITHKIEGDTAYIGTAVKYAAYVEFGTGEGAETGGRKTPWIYKRADGRFVFTKGNPAKPFLRPAINNHIDEYNKIIRDEFSE